MNRLRYLTELPGRIEAWCRGLPYVENRSIDPFSDIIIYFGQERVR